MARHGETGLPLSFLAGCSVASVISHEADLRSSVLLFGAYQVSYRPRCALGKGRMEQAACNSQASRPKRQNITRRSSFFPGVSGSHDLPLSCPSSNPVSIARPDEATQPSLTCQGRRTGCNQTSLKLSRAGLDCLSCMHYLHDSGRLGALPTSDFFPPSPMVSPFPIEAAVCNLNLNLQFELEQRVSSLNHGGEP